MAFFGDDAGYRDRFNYYATELKPLYRATEAVERYMQGVPKRLGIQREREKLTFQAIAEQIGITHGTVQHWLSGYIEISVKNLVKISEVFGCSFCELAYGRLSPYDKGIRWCILNNKAHDRSPCFTPDDIEDKAEKLTKDIPQRLRSIRKLWNLNQDDLAAAIDTSRSTVSKWEGGYVKISLANLLLLSQVLNADFEWLATGRYDNRCHMEEDWRGWRKVSEVFSGV